ncbi:MAG: polysaccharide deacetylase family protein [Sphingomonadales bacterium]|nr:polysaccharide deacetylase family protein [Sphingomonadales bacterium]
MSGRALGLVASAMLGTPRLFRQRGAANVSALLFHRFFADGEPRQRGIDRLRRELEWLRAAFVPVSLGRFVEGMADGSLPDRAVLVTTDDAHRDVLEVADTFAEYAVPFAVFVCAGWTAEASEGTGEDLLARVVSAIQWYEGTPTEVRYGGRSMVLAPARQAANIDALLAAGDIPREALSDLCSRIDALSPKPRGGCTWADLRALAGNAAIGIGAHSVSHIRLSQASALRRRFEIAESRRLCETLIGRCEAFAYPYGTDDAHSPETRTELAEAGFSTGFLTHSDFITTRSERLTLPRLSMPDDPMGFAEFRARARGAGIVMRRLKQALRGARPA